MVPRHRGTAVVICTSIVLQVWLTLHARRIPR
jgi:hypothetical protein